MPGSRGFLLGDGKLTQQRTRYGAKEINMIQSNANKNTEALAAIEFITTGRSSNYVTITHPETRHQSLVCPSDIDHGSVVGNNQLWTFGDSHKYCIGDKNYQSKAAAIRGAKMALAGIGAFA
jgi:threonine aldolase